MSVPFLRRPAFKLLQKAIAERVAPLVIVTGSGMSVEAGLPDWKQLRQYIQRLLEDQEHEDQGAGIKDKKGLYDSALETEDYWLFFKLAKKILTAATFREAIREYLTPQDLELPEGYKELLKLKPKGLVTLNLDRLAALAIAHSNPGKPITQVDGGEIASKWHAIKNEKPFLVHMHGMIEDSSTWVLDSDELSALTTKLGHSHFLTNLYLEHTVLFVGVSADDIALSAPLVKLNAEKFEARRLFWFTNRIDEKTKKWAEDNQVQQIIYSATKKEEHKQAISHLVGSIVSFNSVDEPRPVPNTENIKSFGDIEVNLSPEEISVLPPENVRKTLNTVLASTINGLSGDELYSAFMQFSEEYDFPIQTRAFYRSGKSPNNRFFDYELEFPALGTGNFGTVYGAKDQEGRQVAVKIMHNTILHTEEMLGGFRRGSNSMKILGDYNVQGVAQYLDSYEMPPTIIMDFVAGNSIEELFENFPTFSWAFKASIAKDISNIVDECHKLPVFVLHRDIKPSNIMLEGVDFYENTYEKVVVLDFDMSWHKGSSEKDVIFESRDDFAYLAPEQTDSTKLGTSRSTKVDSYGLGMTTYAMFSGVHPIPNAPLNPKWSEIVLRASKNKYAGAWKCLPARLSRFILAATEFEQSDRLEFSSAKRRLNKIVDVFNEAHAIVPLDVAAEEILCRCSDGQKYIWSDLEDQGEVEFPSGISVHVQTNTKNLSIELKFEYNDKGSKSYNNRNKLLDETKNKLSDLFSSDGYREIGVMLNHGLLQYTGSAKETWNIKTIEAFSEKIIGTIRTTQKII